MKVNSDIHPNLMKAVVLHKFGTEEQLVTELIPVPEVEEDEVLIKLEVAGVGQWDIFEREGGYAEMMGMEVKFPYVLGSEGSGTIVSKGENVKNFKIGDKVIGTGFLNPKGGFYAEFVVINYNYVSHIPECISADEAGVISGVGITALRGLEDVLNLKRDESIVIFGASGGVGHAAVQLAKQIGAKVFAIASGSDGVEMVRELGIKNVVDGYRDDLPAAANLFAPDGFDAALFTAGGETTQTIMQLMKSGGRIAFPNGIYPLPTISDEVKVIGYNGEPDADIINRLNNHIKSGSVKAHIDKSFLLEDAYSAHLALNNHYLGKLCLRVKQTK